MSCSQVKQNEAPPTVENKADTEFHNYIDRFLRKTRQLEMGGSKLRRTAKNQPPLNRPEDKIFLKKFAIFHRIMKFGHMKKDYLLNVTEGGGQHEENS